MISQQQNDIHVPEKETPPPVDQKQPSVPASSWRGWSLWLRIFGTVVPLVAAFELAQMSTPDEASRDVFLLSVAFVGVVSASLLRSWWSLLIAPVVFNIGFLLGESYIYNTLDHFFQNLFPLGAGFDNFFQNLLTPGTMRVEVIVLLEVGVLIGILIGKNIERRYGKDGVVMIPQNHLDEILPQEQVPSTIKERKARLYVKNILVLVAILLLIAGMWYISLLSDTDSGLWVILGCLFAFVSGLFCGILTRSLWSLLAVSVLSVLGLWIGAQVSPLEVYGEIQGFIAMLFIFVFPIVALVGAALGKPIGLRLERRLTKQ